MADISGRFLQLKAVSPLLVGQNWETRIAADSAGTLWQSVKGAAYVPLGGGLPADPWFAANYAAIKALDPLLTDVTFESDCGLVVPQFQANSAGTGSVTQVVRSALDLQTGGTASGDAQLSNNGNATILPNMRTERFAFAVKVTKIGTVSATSDMRIANLGDNATTNACVGMLGSIDAVNYSLNVHTTHVATAKAQSPVGTYDTLVLWNDLANYHALIGLAGTALVDAAQTASANAQTAAVFITLRALNNATAANQGFRVDKVMLIQAAAT